MKIYRTTRYNYLGRLMWQRYSTGPQRYSATCGEVKYHGGSVELEVAEIPEPQWSLVKKAGASK